MLTASVLSVTKSMNRMSILGSCTPGWVGSGWFLWCCKDMQAYLLHPGPSEHLCATAMAQRGRSASVPRPQPGESTDSILVTLHRFSIFLPKGRNTTSL